MPGTLQKRLGDGKKTQLQRAVRGTLQHTGDTVRSLRAGLDLRTVDSLDQWLRIRREMNWDQGSRGEMTLIIMSC